MALNIEEAAAQVGCSVSQLYRFLRRVERGLGYRGPTGSGDFRQRTFTAYQIDQIRLAWNQPKTVR